MHLIVWFDITAHLRIHGIFTIRLKNTLIRREWTKNLMS